MKECGAWDNWGAGVILVDLLTQGTFRTGAERMWFADVALRDLTMYKAVEEYVNIGKSDTPVEYIQNRLNEMAADPRIGDAAGSLTNGAAFLKGAVGVLDQANVELMLKGLLNEDPLLRMTALTALDSPIIINAKAELTPAYEQLNKEFGF